MTTSREHRDGARHQETPDADWRGFAERFDEEFPRLESLFTRIYGDSPAVAEHLASLVSELTESWQTRPVDLRRLDAKREAEPDWFLSNRMLGGVCYVDLYAGDLSGIRDRIPYFVELGLTYLHLMPLFLAPSENSDGGYAVSSYRQVNPSLGTMQQLTELATELRSHGISLVIDFIFNHTSNEHEWARKALARDPEFENFYWIFPDREMPDEYEQTVREIFPDDHSGSFVQLDDGRWVWATFHSFQWDLNYSNPAVFRAMAGELLFLANAGVDVVRMDAVAFIWKKLGTTSENLPEAHLLLQAFNAVCRIVAPSLLFKSEAIVHPDEVAQYISPGECQLSYNPLQMALIWNSLATREVGLLSQALERRHAISPGTAWVNYVRSHDDIGWTFADEDARELGIDGVDHRRSVSREPEDRGCPRVGHHGIPRRSGGRRPRGRLPHRAGALDHFEHGRNSAAVPRRRGGAAERLRSARGAGPGRRQSLGRPAALPRFALRLAAGCDNGCRERLPEAASPHRRAAGDAGVRRGRARAVRNEQPARAGLPAHGTALRSAVDRRGAGQLRRDVADGHEGDAGRAAAHRRRPGHGEHCRPLDRPGARAAPVRVAARLSDPSLVE
jgi:hypothetical protein